jgi:hypothetical protein
LDNGNAEQFSEDELTIGYPLALLSDHAAEKRSFQAFGLILHRTDRGISSDRES